MAGFYSLYFFEMFLPFLIRLWSSCYSLLFAEEDEEKVLTNRQEFDGFSEKDAPLLPITRVEKKVIPKKIAHYKKKGVTVPQEFNLSVRTRILNQETSLSAKTHVGKKKPLTNNIMPLKKERPLTVCSGSHLVKKSLSKNTMTNPFHLHRECQTEAHLEKKHILNNTKHLKKKRALTIPRVMVSKSPETHLEKKPLPKNTMPTPFQLHTEERGAEKKKMMAKKLSQKRMEQKRARIPKAQPLPCTTDYYLVPPKPEPKPCTKQKPFQLKSLLRHEEDIQREMGERRKMKMEEARMRIFRAQPIMQEYPIPVPGKVRKPLTKVKEFNLHVDSRPLDRAEFEKKIKDKEIAYKRYKEEAESSRMMEEEKVVKQLRKTLIPRARPMPYFDRPFLPHKSSKQVMQDTYLELQIDKTKEKTDCLKKQMRPSEAKSGKALKKQV